MDGMSSLGLFAALRRSDEAWARFECMEFGYCWNGYAQRAFRNALDKQIGWAVSERIECVHSRYEIFEANIEGS